MRLLRRVVTGTALVSLLMLTLSVAANAAVFPRPLGQEWWFKAWAVNSEIWPLTQGQGVTVGVLDSGVQANIPDLTGAVLRGTDATNGGGDGRTDTESPGHGTAMATIIAGRGTRTGFLGVAPRAKILPVVAKSSDGITRGIRYAADHGAKVINLSQGVEGGPCPSDMQQSVLYALQHDVIIVAGSGDSGNAENPTAAPANCSGVLAVGAIDSHLKAWSKTESQPYVAISAPGVAVPGVLADGQIHTSEGGTSQASALASAGIALLRSRFPQESRTDILKRVFASLRDAGRPGKDSQTGYGVFRPSYVIKGGVPHSAAYDKWAAANGQKAVHPSKQPSEKPSAEKGQSQGMEALKLFGLPVLVAVLVLLLALFTRSRQRKRSAGGGGPTPPGQMPYGQGQQGPPPSFGPPQNPGPHPGGDQRPSFQPPPNQGPPPERR